MPTIEELERRLQLLEDERELRTLLARYSFNADLGRSREYTALYLEDGAIDTGVQRFDGQEDILWKFITGAGHRGLEARGVQHFTTGPLIFYIDGDEAEAEGYSLVLVKEGEVRNQVNGAMLPEIGVYTSNFNHWRFRRLEGEWRIVERFIRPIGSQERWDVITRTTK
jgi:hypothetical protein